MLKKTLLLVFAAVLMVSAIVVVRTLLHTPPPTTAVEPVRIDLDAERLARHLSESITYRTVSFQSDDEREPEQFAGFIDWVKRTYPAINRELDLVMLNDTMLYRWQGSEDGLQPVLVTGHYDVVPVIPGTEDKWEHPPYSGAIVDGVVWGRGALDDKSGVVGILEAVTYLLDEGFVPARTLYLSFGHDEEIGGPNGAAEVARYLASNNVQLEWSLDEGSFVLDGLLPGLDLPVASINVAEKGGVTLDIVATAAGGHSSMPPRDNAVALLAAAIVKLQDNPVPGGLEGLSAKMFDDISRHFSFPVRALFANQWLFSGLVESQLSAAATTNAMLRTTTAPTMLAGSVKVNVLPIEAIATVNFRVHPRDTPESVQQYVESLVGNDRVFVRSRGGRPASAVSDWNADGFDVIEQGMREVYGDVIVAPGLMIAGSDSRHYGKVADNAYRFNPFVVTSADIAGFHGTNESMKVDDFVQGVKGYIQVIRAGTANPAAGQ